MFVMLMNMYFSIFLYVIITAYVIRWINQRITYGLLSCLLDYPQGYSRRHIQDKVALAY